MVTGPARADENGTRRLRTWCGLVCAPYLQHLLNALSSGFTGVIARIRGRQWGSLFRLFEEMLDDWNHSLRFRVQDEVTHVRDYGDLGVRNELDGFHGVLNADKIVISSNN